MQGRGDPAAVKRRRRRREKAVGDAGSSDSDPVKRRWWSMELVGAARRGGSGGVARWRRCTRRSKRRPVGRKVRSTTYVRRARRGCDCEVFDGVMNTGAATGAALVARTAHACDGCNGGTARRTTPSRARLATPPSTWPTRSRGATIACASPSTSSPTVRPRPVLASSISTCQLGCTGPIVGRSHPVEVWGCQARGIRRDDGCGGVGRPGPRG